MRVIILLNDAAGGGRTSEISTFEGRFADAGFRAEIRTAQGEALRSAAVRAAAERPDILVAAGGDGTISAVAEAVVGSTVILGVLPIGTLNHFAKDLGIVPNLQSAMKVIAGGHVQNLDVGQVNGHSFINNSSIGLYPQMVHHRDHQQLRLGRGKWAAMFFAALAIFRRYPLIQIKLETDTRSYECVTPFVFIGNNRYETHLLALGARPRLDAGELSVYFANRTGRFGLFRLMLRALIGRLNQARDFEILMAREVRIETPRPSIHVALDGEVFTLTPPLHYRILPGALKVLTPAPHATVP